MALDPLSLSGMYCRLSYLLLHFTCNTSVVVSVVIDEAEEEVEEEVVNDDGYLIGQSES